MGRVFSDYLCIGGRIYLLNRDNVFNRGIIIALAGVSLNKVDGYYDIATYCCSFFDVCESISVTANHIGYFLLP